MKRINLLLLLVLVQACASAQALRVAVAGVSHGHSGWILGRANKNDIQLVGIYEKDTALAGKVARQYHFPRRQLYHDLGQMLDAVKPQAVLAFGSVYSHREVVEACAPRGIHVMVEKPLAANLPDALVMDSLARRFGIHLLTNYETSWYPTVAKTFQLVEDSSFTCQIRKVVIHDGHQGPQEIGCSPAFLSWLTDPVLNGGGALMDFGCYGANLMTRLMKNRMPLAVTAVTRHYKPDRYPKVDDDATIIVDYPNAQCIIQASWNWPFSRKDMEVYGDKGYIMAADKNTLLLRNRESAPATARHITAMDIPVYEDPFRYLAAVIQGKETVPPYGVYALANNVLVLRILEAAKESARTGKTVRLVSP
ncbi:Gfo/Idh/MocA family protein [Chitinophaga qingshengii]|uniref:Gfo/Idh/MocA family oxidoreductase n=1 Tax=Chitinophaga qingshengii TaxID=1569794 RepID=A0ABR7TR30_9BACT|nr:Gfo/Idh/MocA family oxidoreductase [Chitinophaga qingshengii]MBC9932933.1 Gfo/Idh/MocA family oxidoreductase [Chitinophaga qingshengii]